MKNKKSLFRCPSCKKFNIGTTDTRPSRRIPQCIRRRRSCKSCQYRWTTYELDKDIFEMIVESRDKLAKVMSIVNALPKKKT